MAAQYDNCENVNKIIIKIKPDTKNFQDILRLYYMPPIFSLRQRGLTHLNSVCQNYGIRSIYTTDEVAGIQHIIADIHPNTLVRLVNENTGKLIGSYLVISDDIDIELIKTLKRYSETVYLVEKNMDSAIHEIFTNYIKPIPQFRHKRSRFVKKSSSKKKRSRSRKPRR